MNQVSVIIPYFKKKQYILSTVKSVINQTYKKLEIIIIYDENDKKNLKFISEICKIDKRIKLIVNKKNLGVAESRNIGIKNLLLRLYKLIELVNLDLSLSNIIKNKLL